MTFKQTNKYVTFDLYVNNTHTHTHTHTRTPIPWEAEETCTVPLCYDFCQHAACVTRMWLEGSTCPQSRRHTHTFTVLPYSANNRIVSHVFSSHLQMIALQPLLHEGFPNLNRQSSWAPQIQCCDQKLFISYTIKFNGFTVALKLFLRCNSNPSL